MKWSELRRTLQSKLRASARPGAKHDTWFVECDGRLVGRVLDSHGHGEVTNRARGHVAESLGIRERDVRDLVACTMSRQDYCAKVGASSDDG